MTTNLLRPEKARLQSLAAELAKNLKTKKNISALSCKLLKILVETALGKEIEEHLSYAKYSHEGRGTGKSHNDTSEKTLERHNGEVEIDTLRDCQGSYSPTFNRI